MPCGGKLVRLHFQGVVMPTLELLDPRVVDVEPECWLTGAERNGQRQPDVAKPDYRDTWRIRSACPNDHQPRPWGRQQVQVGGGNGAEGLMGAAPGNEWHSLTREAACHKEQSRRPRRVRTTANKMVQLRLLPFQTAWRSFRRTGHSW